jgi:UrcA family protein
MSDLNPQTCIPPAMLLMSVLALGALTTAAAANRPTPLDDLPSLTVRYDGLDLNRLAGRKILRARIEQAARIVCGQSFTGNLSMQPAYELCVESATRSALAQVKPLS